MKFPPENLNFGLCPPHPTSIYTYEVTTVPNVRGGEIFLFKLDFLWFKNIFINEW